MIISPQRTSPFNLPLVSGGAFVGLLDTYGGAAAAYSVRRLSSTYTGNLIEVRRSSDNTTQNIGYDANGNLDTAALLAFVGAGDGFVRTWYDQSGNANNVQQTTTSEQPQIVTSGVVDISGSKPAIKFNNINYILQTPVIYMSSQRSYYVVTERIGAAFGNYHNIIIQSSSPYYQIYSPSTTFNFYDGSAKSTGISFDTNQQLVGLNQNLTNGYIYKNNGVDFTYTPNTASINSKFQIGRFTSNLSGLNGYLSEIIIYNESKYSNKLGINNNINSYYSIY